jgi:hypothetical protein
MGSGHSGGQYCLYWWKTETSRVSRLPATLAYETSRVPRLPAALAYGLIRRGYDPANLASARYAMAAWRVKRLG